MPDETSDPAAAMIDDRPAVITGAASGIGRALAEQLGTRGHRLVLVDIDGEGLARLAETLNAQHHAADVADSRAMDRLAEAAPNARLVCLNAGVVSTWPGPVWEAPPDEWDRVLGVNLGGVVNGLRAFVPRLLELGKPASILITASLAGLATWPGGGPYGASKHAVVAVAEQAALALAGSAISITLLCPALVRSAMSDTGDDPHRVASAALDAVDDRRFTVLPAEWQEAVRQRGDRLASGAVPQLPQPA
jgi:NAD(P)-dependent dehydrogenase (short-subunit alcohol dehydrogenase family)